MRRAGLLGLVMPLVLVSGCTGSSGPPPPAGSGSPSAPDLTASATQTRFDESTGAIRAGVTNHGDRAVSVTSATLVWPGFAWPEVETDPTPVLTGQTAAFLIQPGRADCTAAPARPQVRARVDGAEVLLPLVLGEPGLLGRLRASACAGQALAGVADVSLTIGSRVVTRDGAPYFAGHVDVRRVPGSREGVSVVGVLGSVLFDVLPAEAGALPAVLGAAALRVPVLVGPTRRCDPHARGQASQPFLFAVFTRLAGAPEHRTITVPSAAEQRRLNALMDRACG